MEQKTDSASGKFKGKPLLAPLLIIAGVLMLTHNIGWLDEKVYHILVSWPMLLVVIGLYCFSRKETTKGGVLLLIGGCFLLPRLGIPWLPVDLRTFMWPLMLIVMGILVLGRPCNKNRCGGNKWRNNFTTASDTVDGFIRSNIFFGGVKQVVFDEVFKGASIRNYFGGTVIDLRRTSLAEGETYIDVDCNFGGVEIYAPSDWKVVLQANAFLGGCDDQRLPSLCIDQSRVLIVRGNVAFGGVEIKN